MAPPHQWYPVVAGREPGIYKRWSDCQDQVKGFKNAIFKKFKTEEEAKAFFQSESQKLGINGFTISEQITSNEQKLHFIFDNKKQQDSEKKSGSKDKESFLSFLKDKYISQTQNPTNHDQSIEKKIKYDGKQIIEQKQYNNEHLQDQQQNNQNDNQDEESFISLGEQDEQFQKNIEAIIENKKNDKIDTEKILHAHKIEELDIYFPFKPYDIQVDLMRKLQETLNESYGHALLQSPTGTGKTLALLCTALGWQKQQIDTKNKQHKIIYASRTHAQLKQVVKQLKKTVYRPITTTIGSRDHYCIKYKETKNGIELNNQCKLDRRHKQCSYHGRDTSNYKNQIFDLDEFIEYAEKEHFCPFYRSKEESQCADLILMPYNYLLDHKFVQNLEIEFKDAVILFDEAHNVEQNAEEGYSPYISDTLIARAIFDLNDCKGIYQQKKRMNIEPDFFKTIIKYLEKIQEYLAKLRLSPKNDILREGIDIFDIFENDLKLSQLDSGLNLNMLCRIQSTLGAVLRDGLKTDLTGIDTVFCFFKLVCEIWSEHKVQKLLVNKNFIDDPINNFKLYFNQEIIKSQKNNDQKINNVMSLWCLTPSLAFKTLVRKGVKNIILTSGTLEPLNQLQSNLRLPFKHQLVNGHIIDTKKNLFAAVINKGPENQEINFTYNKLQQNKFSIYQGLLESIMKMCENVPNGVLVFFPSYRLLDEAFTIWNQLEDTPLSRLHQTKKIFKEPKYQNMLKSTLQKYSDAANGEGGIFFGVMRGKVSEGLDFPDKLTRAIFVVGIPYPPLFDKKIETKKKVAILCQYLDLVYEKAEDKSQAISGQAWYESSAIRAVNQTIGRLIRHKNDWGAVFFCDTRYSWYKNQMGLSSWIRNSIQNIQSFDILNQASKSFYEQKEVDEEQELNQGMIEDNISEADDEQQNLCKLIQLRTQQ